MWLIFTLITMFFITIIYIINKRTLRYKSKLTLYIIFVSEWAFILIVGIINPYQFFEISQKYSLLLFIGITAWLIGFVLAQFEYMSLFSVKPEIGLTKEMKLQINENIYIFYTAIILIFTVYVASIILNYFRQGYSYIEIHRIAFGDTEESLFTNKFMSRFYNLVMFGIVQAIIPVIIISFFTKNYRNISAVALLSIMGYCLLIGRRFPLLYMIIDIILVLPFTQLKLSRKNIRIIFISIFVLLLGIILFTAWRKKAFETGNWELVYSEFIKYFNISLPIGDYWVNYIDNYHSQTFLIGYSFFKGFLDNIHSLFKILGLDLVYSNLGSELINLPQDNYINIGFQKYYNAFASMIYFFYLDFRYLGVLFGCLIFGFITGFVEVNANVCKKTKMIAFYLLFSQAVFKSFVRWEFNVGSYVMAYFYLYLLFKKVKIIF